VLQKSPFIAPMIPTLANAPPTGPDWLHEVKFDGYRSQLHIDHGDVTIYSRRGNDLTKRFQRLKDVIASISEKSAIIDCELVGCDENGHPDFRALMRRKLDCDFCLWCFDLLSVDGHDLRHVSLLDRRKLLHQIIKHAGERALQFSQHFDSSPGLLIAAERMGLEGIVSKRRDSRYASGRSREWVKVKTAAWRAANADRGEMVEKK
jgi:bifunctional non-homologous end joining protein LigD